MPEFLAGDVHEITAKLAYQLWEQRGRPPNEGAQR
jgi:hypothetical protein